MVKAAKKNDLQLFDVIRRIRKDDDGSIWQGEKGIYIIRHLEQPKPAGKRKKVPLAKVILNHQFLTGLFASKKLEIYTGDVKEGSRRRFMLFKMIDAQQMEIRIQE